MAFSGEVVNVGNGVGADLVDEEFHVSTGDKGLAGPVEYDGVDRIVGVGSSDGLRQLTHDGDVERVHRFGAVDGEGGHAVVDATVNVGEVPSGIALIREEGGNGPAFTGGLGVGLGHAAGFTDADAIHHLKRPAGPSQTHFGAAVNVFHAADVLLYDLSGDTKHHTEQALGHGRVLLVGVGGLLGDVPLFVGLNQRTKVRSPRVARGVELLGEVVGGMERNGWAGQVHQTEGAETDAEGLAGDGVDLGGVRSAFLEQQAGFVQPRDEEAVHDKSGSVCAHDDHLTEHLAVLNDLVDGFLA